MGRVRSLRLDLGEIGRRIRLDGKVACTVQEQIVHSRVIVHTSDVGVVAAPGHAILFQSPAATS